MTWTDERIQQLRSMVEAGRTGGQAGKVLGISRNAAVAKAKRLHLQFKTQAVGGHFKVRTPMTAEQRAEIERLLRTGMGVRTVGAATGFKRDVVTWVRDDAGIPPNQVPIRAAAPVKRSAPKAKAPTPRRQVIKPPVAPPVPVEVRGAPDVWLPPVSRTLAQIEGIAAGLGVSFSGLYDLPALNKRRVRMGLAPLAVDMPRREGVPPLPGVLLAGLPR